MKYRKLGSSGALVSELGLGALAFGSESEEVEAHRILDTYVSEGGNYVDTADVYGDGRAEEIVGNWLSKGSSRSDLILASKFGQYMGSAPNDGGLSSGRIARAVDQSLKRLQTDYLDLYYAHCWDPLTPFDEVADGFDRLVSAGKIRYWGVSNFLGWQLERSFRVAQARSNAMPVVHQVQLSLLARQAEWELLPLGDDLGIGTVAWSPLCGGWLAGNYGRDGVPKGHVRDRSLFVNARRNNEHTWRVIDTLEHLAAEREGTISIAQLALAWVLGSVSVASVLLGPSTVSQLEDGLEASTVSLSDFERNALDDASSIPLPEYPNEFSEMLATPRLTFTGG